MEYNIKNDAEENKASLKEKNEGNEKNDSSTDITRNIEFLFDIPISVTVELGKTKLLLKDVLKLGEGSILGLDKFEGEPVDILVNNKLIAKGEVVVINERFGVKIVDIISTQERVKQLK
jgi:flagellar motor switch protein FliN/FliY